MQRVADQHHISKRPVLVPDPWKIAPDRFVRDQLVANKRASEHALANRFGLVEGFLGKAIALPCSRVALDQERAHLRRISIMVRIKRAEFGLYEGLRQRFETLGRSVPGELVGGVRQGGAEVALEAAAQERVQSIGGNDQIVALQLLKRGDRRLISRRDADRGGALLQDF